MIQNVRGKFAERVINNKFGKSFPSTLIKRTKALLSAMDAAVELEDLRFPLRNHLEKLTGERKDQYSVRLNKQWRICFTWTSKGPIDLEILDYH